MFSFNKRKKNRKIKKWRTKKKEEKKSLFGDLFQNKDNNEQGFGSLFKNSSGILFNDNNKGSIFTNSSESIWGNKNKKLFDDHNTGGIFGIKSSGLFGDKKEEKTNSNEIKDNKDKIVLNDEKNKEEGLNNNILDHTNNEKII